MNILTSIAVIMSSLLSLQGCEAQTIAGSQQDAELVAKTERQFKSIYEPSAAQSLPDGMVLLAEDEARKPLSLIQIDDAGLVTEIGHLHIAGQFDDVEGLAGDGLGRIYAITSHSRTLKGKKQRSRNKLFRFSVAGKAIESPQLVTGLRGAILKQYKIVDKAVSGRTQDFNIEGLGYRRADNALLIGLRTPVIDDDSVIVVLKNPEDVFERKESPKFSDKPIFLDLDKGGIRAIVYDDYLKGYLILSRREDKKDKGFKLWIWGGQDHHIPRRIKFKTKTDLDGAEGITPFRSKSRQSLLIVMDNGEKRKGKGAQFLVMNYDQIEIQMNTEK